MKGEQAMINLWNSLGVSHPKLEQKVFVCTYSVAFGAPESLRSFAALVSL